MQLEPRQGGFSLIEVIVATVILTFGLMAMAASTTYVGAQLNSARFDTERTVAKSRMIEELRATPYTSLATNTSGRMVGRYTISWNVTAMELTKRVQLITSGNAYRADSGNRRSTFVDTMTFEILAP